MHQRRPLQFLLTLPTAILAATLAGCATTPEPKVEVDQARVAAYRAGGYAYRGTEGVAMHRIEGVGAQAAWTVTVARSRKAGSGLPVIVYLPGLGDDDRSPIRWIDLWSDAGYAVVVLQALEDDAKVWTSADARSGDFTRIARARFDDEWMDLRVARLAAVLADLRSRADAPLAGVDWSRLALAGDDLGAYTVQTIARMKPAELAAVGWPQQACAYLAISPYARREAQAQDDAQALNGPMLMVSAPTDVDAYGVVTDAALRRSAFARLGGGERYFLELSAVSHGWLSGRTPDVLTSADAVARRTPLFREPGQNLRTHGNAPGLTPMDDDEAAREAVAQGHTRAEADALAAAARSRRLTESALSETGFELVTIAFLDSQMRRSEPARQWLRGPAANWLQGGDHLEVR
jgi:hypothetical protein